MRKIREKELKQEVQHFNGKKVIIKYKGLVNAIIYIRKLSIYFDYKTGFLYMKDIIQKNKFKVNIIPAYSMQIKEDNTELMIKLYYSIYINIKINKWVDLFYSFTVHLSFSSRIQ